MLYALDSGEVTSKKAALEWAKHTLHPRWPPLIQQVLVDRPLGWDPTEPPRPASVELTLAFADYATDLAAGGRRPTLIHGSGPQSPSVSPR
jgi:hypothetical protein